MNGRVPVDPLLEAFERDRTGDEAEAVTRIRAAQDEVISRPPDELLLVQGSAGTGTMVVGVRRVSWLLRTHRERFADDGILVVGPTPSFVRQLSSVVPSTGDDVAVQVPLTALGPRVRVGRSDPPEVSRLKGDMRLLRVIQRALRHRQRITAGPVELTIDGRRVRLDGERIAQYARELAGRPHNDAHRELRAFLLTEIGDRLGEDPSDVPARTVVAGSASVNAVDDYLDRAWPEFTSQSFLLGLLANPRQLAAAAAGSLSDEEVGLLTIPPDARVVDWRWSLDDVALLDAADELLNGAPATYEHIVVHEAQDLSPLQLESIRRRSRTGGMTVLGDLAQGTSAWAHSSWDDVVGPLEHDGVPVMTAELKLGYRLPSEVHEMTAGLLPVIAPGMRPPRALRSSRHEVQLVGPTGPGLAAAVAATVRSLIGTGSIAVVAPHAEQHAVTEALDDAGIGWSRELDPAGGPVVVSSPAGCRGLELDSVVVVEPAQILREGPHGERALYVALTRCTDRLAIVHDRPLPDAIDRRHGDPLPGVAPAPVPSGARPAPGMGETGHRPPAEAVGDDAPTAAVPAVAPGETGPGVGSPGEGSPGVDRPLGGRFDDGTWDAGAVEDRGTTAGRSEDGVGGGGHRDGWYAGDRYGDGRYDSDRYDDDGTTGVATPGDEGDRQARSGHNGMFGFGSEPPGWRQPAEAGPHDSRPTVPRRSGSATPEQPPAYRQPLRGRQPGVERRPAFQQPGVEEPPGFEQPRVDPRPGFEGSSARRPPGAQRPMHGPPPGPAVTPEVSREPGTRVDSWRAEPPPSHAVSGERAPWRRAPEPGTGAAPEPADAGAVRTVPAGSPPEPFAELDRAIAHAIAKALTEKLARYATTELLPLVAEEMVRVIGRRTGRPASSAASGHDARRGDPPG